MLALRWFVFFSLIANARDQFAATIDPRGPIDNVGIHPVVDADGVRAPRFTFDPQMCAKPGPWQAKWIWLPVDPHRVAATAFRKEITLASAPKRVAAWMSADIKFRLYINGRLAARGPVDQGRDYQGGSTERWFYDYRDLTQYFAAGKNEIAVEVFQHWPIGFTVSRGHPGLIFEMEATLADDSKQTLASDTSWKALPADWFSAANGLTYDASREPAGWRMAGFADSQWKNCEVTPDIWSPLIPSEIPPLMERYPILRIDNVQGAVKVPNDASKTGRGITVSGDGSFRVVFDRVLSAYPTLKVRGGRGAHVAIHAHRQANAILGSGGAGVSPAVESAGGTPAPLTYFEFPFMDEIAPAFTVSFSNVIEPIIVEDVGGANFTSQPVDYLGSFECSDEKLNKIWKASRWAVQICMQTHHLDSPNHQEPICDPGDYVIEAMVSYYAFGQPWLARQDIRKFAWLLKNEKYRCFHTSYALYWLQMLDDYTAYTGDTSLMDEMRPYVYELIDTFKGYVGKNGLISEAPNYMFMDWVEIGGFNCHHPPAVIGQGYLTALYGESLLRAAAQAGAHGDGQRFRQHAAAYERIRSRFDEELWDDAHGLYRDGKPRQTSVKPGQWLPADKQIETFSPHVNLLAVLYVLQHDENAKRRKQIVEKVLSSEPLNTQPWFMHWVFAAIDKADLFDKYGTSQLHRWEIVPETQSFHEMWHGGDLSHGWCSTPLVQMSSRMLGVEPVTVGFKAISIRPRICDLQQAKGTVPTPRGVVSVAWRAEPDLRSVEVTIPSGSSGNIYLPTRGWQHPMVIVDGLPKRPATSGDNYMLYFTKSGTHRFEIRNEKSHHDN